MTAHTPSVTAALPEPDERRLDRRAPDAGRAGGRGKTAARVDGIAWAFPAPVRAGLSGRADAVIILPRRNRPGRELDRRRDLNGDTHAEVGLR